MLEAVRRSMLHLEKHIILQAIPNIDGILQAWKENTNACRVTMFTVHFLRTVARPPRSSIQFIKVWIVYFFLFS